MGNSIEKEGFNLEQEFREAGLGEIDPYVFENQFEKEVYMSINLIRSNPKRFIKHFEHVKDFKEYKGKKGKQLIKQLATMESLPPLAIDQNAIEACRQSNVEITSSKREIKGGNIEKMRTIVLANFKSYEGQDFTVTSWRGSPHELVIYNMLQDFEINGKSTILDFKTFKVGLSFYGHREKENVCQILYVFQLSNQIF
ncbi:UNKNOWN [Stylonychia lemnae]|uniref:Uncharacterized protein n=1 Tax=Stylonychia lemnae TaxID=5949 RepID=A0A078B3T8_STYLE|nr:UNKNOWN [Stylonychia lemnae]|eukprot:CDW89154.1 UNKNOWN [Stylonychia lemnae]